MQLRTPQHYADYSRMAELGSIRDPPLFGFKNGPRPLPLLNPRLPYSLPLDSMHQCFIGVMKFLLKTIIKRDPDTHLPYFDDETDIGEVDALIARIFFPTRFAPQIKELLRAGEWQASEMRCFAFIGPVVLMGLLSDVNALNAIVVFCCAMVMLHRDVIKEEHIQCAEKLLDGFHESLRSIFGTRSLYANMHGLQHLGEHARRYGSLNNISAFHFEGHIGTLGRLVTGPIAMIRQIADRFSVKVKHAKEKPNYLVSDLSLSMS